MNLLYATMNLRAVLAVLATVYLPANRDTTSHPSAPPGYELVWADEFEGNGWPDPRNWTYERAFVRNQELQWYQADNAEVKNGLLIIEARRESKPNPSFEQGSADWRRSREQAEFTSASLTTRGLHSWRYGRFEMRARIDVRAGMWRAGGTRTGPAVSTSGGWIGTRMRSVSTWMTSS